MILHGLSTRVFSAFPREHKRRFHSVCMSRLPFSNFGALHLIQEAEICHRVLLRLSSQTGRRQPVDLYRLNQFSLPLDVQAICRIRLCPRFGDDFIAWEPEKNGQFTVRSAYWLPTGEPYAPSLASTNSARDGHMEVWK